MEADEESPNPGISSGDQHEEKTTDEAVQKEGNQSKSNDEVLLTVATGGEDNFPVEPSSSRSVEHQSEDLQVLEEHLARNAFVEHFSRDEASSNSSDDEKATSIPHESKQRESSVVTPGSKRPLPITHSTAKQKKPRANVSFVWDHFVKVGLNKCKCEVCGRELSTQSTTTLKYHLKNRHNILDPNESVEGERGDSATSKQTEKRCDEKRQESLHSFGIRPGASSTFHKKTSQHIAKMIALDLHPVSTVEGIGFKQLMNHLDPSYVVPHRTTFTRTYLPDLMEDLKEKVVKTLGGAFHLTLTTDGWEDDYANNKYMSITAHFISESWTMVTFLLETVFLVGSATGELIAKNLAEVEKEFRIDSKTRSLVTDQGSNVLKAGRIASYHTEECFAHRLDLCLTTYGLDAADEWKAVLNKCKEIVHLFRRKGQEVRAEQKRLKKEQDQRNLLHFMDSMVENDHNYANISVEIGTTSLKRHVSNRWSSICIMVDSVLKNRVVIQALLVKYKKTKLILRAKELRALEMLLEFLMPFKEMTTTLQAEKWPTLSRVWPAIRCLKMECQPKSEEELGMEERSSSDDDENDGVSTVNYSLALEKLKEKVLSALEKKFPRDPVCILATTLDLRFRGFEDLDIYTTAEEMMDGIEIFLDAIKDSVQYYTTNTSSNGQSVNTISTFSKRFRKYKDTTKDAGVDEESDLPAEIRKYLALKAIPEKELDAFNLLHWWRDHTCDFPQLAKIAQKVHSIVATSAPSERMFSTSGNIVTEKRSRLLPAHVNMLLFIHTNYRALMGIEKKGLSHVSF